MTIETPDWLLDRRNNPRYIEYSRELGEVDESPLLADVAFNRHSMNDGHHVSPSDNGKVQIGADGIIVKLAQKIDEDALKKTLSAAVRATIGLDVSQTLPGDWEHCAALEAWAKERIGRGQDFQGYAANGLACDHEAHRLEERFKEERVFEGQAPMADWEEMLKGGLQTALETQVIVLAVSGVSRTCTHQLVRSRRASFHQQSQRAGYMGDCPEVRLPESIWKNERALNAVVNAYLTAHQAYRICCEEDISYQDARYVLPEGTTNFILLEYTVREFLNVFAYRACSMFSWEIVHVMREAKKVLIAEHPWLEPYIKISCEKTGPVEVPATKRDLGMPSVLGHDPKITERLEHHCTFQGWEDVTGQCDLPWGRDEARTFKPEFHRISRKA